MSNWVYDSGGKTKHQDKEKYNESYDKIFNTVWPCIECNGTRSEGHKEVCTKHWKNK